MIITPVLAKFIVKFVENRSEIAIIDKNKITPCTPVVMCLLVFVQTPQTVDYRIQPFEIKLSKISVNLLKTLERGSSNHKLGTGSK